MSKEVLEKAYMWYSLHKDHVNKLLNSTKTEYPPTELEDINNPNLWKGEHWRWFLAINAKYPIRTTLKPIEG